MKTIKKVLCSIGNWCMRRAKVQKQGFTKAAVIPIATVATAVPAIKDPETRFTGIIFLAGMITAPIWVPVLYFSGRLND